MVSTGGLIDGAAGEQIAAVGRGVEHAEQRVERAFDVALVLRLGCRRPARYCDCRIVDLAAAVTLVELRQRGLHQIEPHADLGDGLLVARDRGEMRAQARRSGRDRDRGRRSCRPSCRCRAGAADRRADCACR